MVAGSKDRPGGIGLCPSAPHRAILGLVRVAVGRPIDAGLRRALEDDLRASDPEVLVKIAFDSYVHVVIATAFERDPALATAVPGDLVIFFREMQTANLRRNRAILGQLETIGAALSQAGLRAVALKGAAELLRPVFPDPAFRFLSDVDILLPAADLDQAVDALRAIGGVSDPDDPTEYHDHHHVAPLSRADWPVPVELHRAVGHGAADDRILPAVTLLGNAHASGVPGLAVPDGPHRLAHCVLHAQLHGQRQRSHVLSLRDALEFDILSETLPTADTAAAQARFAVDEDRAAWQALAATRRLIFGAEDAASTLPDTATAWAAKAVDLYGRPKRQRARTALATALAVVSDLVFDPRRRRQHVRRLTRPGLLRRALSHHWKANRRIR